jgi:V/A-type H+-transporting ATPase subunit C
MREDAVSTYGFINAKLRARIGMMRQSRLVENLFRAPSLVDAVALLRDSPYRRVAEVYDHTGDLQQMELVLLEVEIGMYRLVTKYLEGRPTVFINHLLAKIELDNLKNVIRLWYSSIIRRRPIRYRSEYLYKDQILNPIDWTALINATTWSDVTSILALTPYHSAIAAAEESDIEERGLFDLENRLDYQWYVTLMEVSTLLSRTDREVATSIFNVEMDLRNLQLLVRYGSYYKMEGEHLASMLLPWGKVYQGSGDYLALEPEQRDPVAIINRHYPGLEEIGITALKENLHSDEPGVVENLKIEEYLAKRRGELYRKILVSDPFTIGLALAYFFLFKEEIRTIKAVINGKYYGYDETYIRGVLG